MAQKFNNYFNLGLSGYQILVLEEVLNIVAARSVESMKVVGQALLLTAAMVFWFAVLFLSAILQGI